MFAIYRVDMALEPKYIRSLPPIVAADRHVKRYYVTNTAAKEGGGFDSAVEPREFT